MTEKDRLKLIKEDLEEIVKDLIPTLKNLDLMKYFLESLIQTSEGSTPDEITKIS